MPESPVKPVSPSLIMELSTAYWQSQAFLTANRIGLFAQLANGPANLPDLASALQLQERPALLLLNACVALGLLEFLDGMYANAPVSEQYLVPGKPAYMGDAVRYSDDLYTTWGSLEQVLQGQEIPGANTDYLGDDEQRTRHFVHGMHNRALGIGQALVQMLDLEGRTRMLDIGGGPGTYSALFIRRFPALRATVLDLPPICGLAREIVAGMEVGDRVGFLPGDYHSTDFPADNDVVLISGVMHRESPAGCRKLIRKAADSLGAGGMLIISDVFTDAGGTGPAFAALFGLNMLLTAADGGVHSLDDMQQWMLESDLGQFQQQAFPPPMPHRFVTGIKV